MARERDPRCRGDAILLEPDELRHSIAARAKALAKELGVERLRASAPEPDLREDQPVEHEIRYARSGGVAIAYQLVGDGGRDLVYVPDFVSNLVYGWESRHWRDFYEQLARSFRLILFDKRGTGLSDHGGQFAALETRMEDLHAVLDAAGSTSTVLLGVARRLLAWPPCTPPPIRSGRARSPSFILSLTRMDGHTEPGELGSRSCAIGGARRRYCDELLEDTAPSFAARPRSGEWFANWLRVGASPAAAYALNRAWIETDLREVLPAVRVPTLVLYRPVAGMVGTDGARRGRPDPRCARAACLGDGLLGHLPFTGDPEEVARFVAGEQVPDVPESVLATLLFTDIVGSTERAAELGDRAWRELLERHHALVRRELSRFRGEERDTAGDGFFATFDGPARAIRCAQAIVDGMRDSAWRCAPASTLASASCTTARSRALAVSIGARVAAAAGPDEVLVSQTVKDLVAGTGLALEDRGERELKGVPGTWRLYAATEEADVEAASGRSAARA